MSIRAAGTQGRPPLNRRRRPLRNHCQPPTNPRHGGCDAPRRGHERHRSPAPTPSYAAVGAGSPDLCRCRGGVAGPCRRYRQSPFAPPPTLTRPHVGPRSVPGDVLIRRTDLLRHAPGAAQRSVVTRPLYGAFALLMVVRSGQAGGIKGTEASLMDEPSPRSHHLRCPDGVSVGGAAGIRTPDLLIANETRYQLRHSPLMRTKQ